MHQLPTDVVTAKQPVLSSNCSPYSPRLPLFPKGFFSQKPQWHQPSIAGRTKAKKEPSEEAVRLVILTTAFL